MRAATELVARTIVREAKAHLESRTSWEKVEEHLTVPVKERSSSLRDVYRGLVEALTDRQGMQNTIGDRDRLAPVLSGFDPAGVVEEYEGDWRALFKAIEREIRPASRMDIDNARSYWVIFCKGAVDGARYLAEIGSLSEFTTLVDTAVSRPQLAPGFALMLAQEIHGLGFALACDFLKEQGWDQFPKPDVHVTDILKGLDLSDGSEAHVFNTMTILAGHLDESPYWFDKLLWLIGSGKLYRVEEKFAADKHAFIAQARTALDRLPSKV